MDVLWRKIILKEEKKTESKSISKKNTSKRREASYTRIGSEVNLHKNYSFRQNGYKVLYIFVYLCYLKEKLMVILMERKQK